MSEKTNISWCDSTVNWWSGCTMVKDQHGGLKESGCARCYAKTRDDRMMIEPVSHWGKGAPRLKHSGAVKNALAMNRRPWICDNCGTAHATIPNLCTKSKEPGTQDCYSTNFHRRRIFSLSLGDWLDEEVQAIWLLEMLYTVMVCDQCVWILCTKRPENFSKLVGKVMDMANEDAFYSSNEYSGKLGVWLDAWLNRMTIPKNIIILASVENQDAAEQRIPELLKIPAACHGLSCEPLLSEVNLGEWLFDEAKPLKWIIAGGESGQGARMCSIGWLNFLRIQCQETATAFFCKQLGSNPGTIYTASDSSEPEFVRAYVFPVPTTLGAQNKGIYAKKH
jgi:protein gp37